MCVRESCTLLVMKKGGLRRRRKLLNYNNNIGSSVSFQTVNAKMHHLDAPRGLSSIPHSRTSRAIYWGEHGPIVSKENKIQDRPIQKTRKNAYLRNERIASQGSNIADMNGWHEQRVSLGTMMNSKGRFQKSRDVTDFVHRRGLERKRERVREGRAGDYDYGAFDENDNSDSLSDAFEVQKLPAGALTSEPVGGTIKKVRANVCILCRYFCSKSVR